MRSRVYLDWNATTPLRPEARQAMVSALDMQGNPSSVHREGRAVRSVVERSREEIAEILDLDPECVVFTSGATEAAALALSGGQLRSAAIEHEAVLAWTNPDLEVGETGAVIVDRPSESVLQLANGETGIMQEIPQGIRVTDATQAVGKYSVNSELKKAGMAITSAHKFGGPKGIGALLLRSGEEVEACLRGGGQELGRRSGTENVAAIAGFAAAVAAAARDVSEGLWDEVAETRNLFEERLQDSIADVVVIGSGSPRLPNTSCFARPGWKGETQVIQMDLDGFAISAGSACSSGKVGDRRALKALGISDEVANSAVRVSFGPTSDAGEVLRFADAWIRRCVEHQARRHSARPQPAGRAA